MRARAVDSVNGPSEEAAIYARERVDHAWLVDPIAPTLEVLRLNDGHWTIVATAADAEVVRVEPFEAIELDLSLLWEMPVAGA